MSEVKKVLVVGDAVIGITVAHEMRDGGASVTPHGRADIGWTPAQADASCVTGHTPDVDLDPTSRDHFGGWR